MIIASMGTDQTLIYFEHTFLKIPIESSLNWNSGYLVILIWLFLPFFVYWLIHNRQNKLARKYSVTTQGKIVDVSWEPRVGIFSPGKAHLAYTYSVAGTKYTGHGIDGGESYKSGEEIWIGYNPEQPSDSILWLHTPKIYWILLGFLWFAVLFGIAYILFYCSVLAFFSAARFSLRRAPQWKYVSRSTIILFTLISILIGIIFVLFGFNILFSHTFLEQNLVWVIINGLSMVSKYE